MAGVTSSRGVRPGGDRVVVAHWGARFMAAFLGAGVTWVWFAILSAIAPHSWISLFVGVGTAVGVCVILRGALLGLVVRADGVTVRQLFRTTKLAWPDIARFTDGLVILGEGSDEHWVLRIDCRDGRRLQVFATFHGNVGDPDTVEYLRSVAAQHSVAESLTGKPAAPGVRSRRRKWAWGLSVSAIGIVVMVAFFLRAR